jgi:pimeloyl-ACP methyl ester carboxylesterase
MRHSRYPHYWRNLGLFTLGVVLLWGMAGAVWLAHARAGVLVHPGRSRPARTPADLGVAKWQEIQFLSADGLRLYGWFIPPDPLADGALLIYVHGLANNRGELLEQAIMLRAHGYGALLFDLRNHGESEGTITTLGHTEVDDLRGAVAFAQTLPGVNADRIGVVGRSMGGAVAIRGAARIPEVRAVAVQSTYSSVEDNVAEGTRAFTGLPAFPFAPLVIWFGEREAGLDIGQVRPIDDVAQIAPRAVLFIHGELDGAILPENSVRLYEAAGEPKELYLVSGAGHGGFLDVAQTAFEQRLVRFFDTYLRGE